MDIVVAAGLLDMKRSRGCIGPDAYPSSGTD